MDVVSLIKKHEGLRLQPYLDTARKLTIGYGRNLDAKGISADEAEVLLTNDVAGVISELTRYSWFNSCSSVRQAVLVDMAFNLGVAGLLEFHILLECVSRGDWAGAASQMAHSEWARQVGVRAVEDAKIMSDGVFTDGTGSSAPGQQG